MDSGDAGDRASSDRWPATGLSLVATRETQAVARQIADHLGAALVATADEVERAVAQVEERAEAQRVTARGAEAASLARDLEPFDEERDAELAAHRPDPDSPEAAELRTSARRCIDAERRLSELDGELAAAISAARSSSDAPDLGAVWARAAEVEQAEADVRAARAGLGGPVVSPGLDSEQLEALVHHEERATSKRSHAGQLGTGLSVAAFGLALILLGRRVTGAWVLVAIPLPVLIWSVRRWRRAHLAARDATRRLADAVHEAGVDDVDEARERCRAMAEWTDRSVRLAKAEDRLETAGRAFRQIAGPDVGPGDLELIEARLAAAATARHRLPQLESERADARREAVRLREDWRRTLERHGLALRPPRHLDDALAAIARRGDGPTEPEIAAARRRMQLRRRLQELAAPGSVTDLVTAGASADELAAPTPDTVVLADPFADLTGDEQRAMLERLSDAADTVNVVVVTGHPAAHSWGVPVVEWGGQGPPTVS